MLDQRPAARPGQGAAMNVANWLRALGLERYEAAFRENDVSAEELCHLTAEDLEGLGVAAIGDRRRLLVAIAKLRDDAASLQSVRSTTDDQRPDTVIPAVASAMPSEPLREDAGG